MNVISHLEPRPVFRFFEEMCAIPHGSHNTKAISDYCARFARERGLEYHQDELNNIVIRKPAAPGYEQADTIILQGHLDMVCEKDADCPIDMEKEGLQLGIDGDWIYAKGTSLGGDDCIAVAIALAVLDAKDLPHPAIEAVFTVDEEVGMLGAVGISPELIRGRKLLNIDSEVEGVLTVSCAGGLTVHSSLPVKREAFCGVRCAVSVSGCKGGHSGTEIHKGRGNATILLGRLLRQLQKHTQVRLLSFSGGTKDNAIPVSARAEIAVADAAMVQHVAQQMTAQWRAAFGGFDPDIRAEASVGDAGEFSAADTASTGRVLDLLYLTPDGMLSRSPDIEGLTQSSLNLGVANMTDDGFCATYLLRSSLAAEKQLTADRLIRLTELLGGTVKTENEYPAWEYNRSSRLRQDMICAFEETYGHAPKVEAVHAGLECGILCGKLPGLDCISYGPDLPDIHTPRERLGISSVRRTWELTCSFLRRAK